ncbi:MAG: hypothetical protein WBS54_07195 [Acidobacteriota bacterium]
MSEPARLPHAFPFRFIPRDDGGGVLQFSSSADDAVSRGGPVPSWVVLEAMTQAGGLLAASGQGSGGVLVQVARFRSPRPIWPGDSLELAGTLVKRMGSLFQVRVTARLGGRLAARGLFTLRETP